MRAVKTTDEQREAFCELTVSADADCPEIISLAHVLYYHCDEFHPNRLIRTVEHLRLAFDNLGFAIQRAEELMGLRPRVATNTAELMKQLRDSVALCNGGRDD